VDAFAASLDEIGVARTVREGLRERANSHKKKIVHRSAVAQHQTVSECAMMSCPRGSRDVRADLTCNTRKSSVNLGKLRPPAVRHPVTCHATAGPASWSYDKDTSR